MDALKTQLANLKPQFGGVHIHITATPDSRLHVGIEADLSVDLPGDLDALVAGAAAAIGLGNSAPAAFSVSPQA